MAKSLDYKLSNMVTVKKTDAAVKVKKSAGLIDLTDFADPETLEKFFDPETDRVLIAATADLKKISRELGAAKTFEQALAVLDANRANVFSDFKLRQFQKNFTDRGVEKMLEELRGRDLEIKNGFAKLSRNANSAYLESGIWTLYACSHFLEGVTTVSKNEIKAPLINVPVDFVTEGARIYLVKKDRNPVLNERLYVFLMREYGTNVALKDFVGRTALDEIIADLEQITKQPVQASAGQKSNPSGQLRVVPGFVCINTELTGGKLKQDLYDILRLGGPDPFEPTSEQKSVEYYQNQVVSGSKILLQVHRPINIYQKYAIASSLSQNTVIIGAPGTGKSEVITNLIANIVYEGKTAMLVSEKKAALDVLIQRVGKLNSLILYAYDFDSKDNFYSYVLNMEEKLGQWYRNDEFGGFDQGTALADKIKEFSAFYSHFSDLIGSEVAFANKRDPYGENYIDFASGRIAGSQIVEPIRIANPLTLPDGATVTRLWSWLGEYVSRHKTDEIAKKFARWYEANEYIFDVANFDEFLKIVWSEYVNFKNLCEEHAGLLGQFPAIIKTVLHGSFDVAHLLNAKTTALAKYICFALRQGVRCDNPKQLRFHRFASRAEKKTYKALAADFADFLKSFSEIHKKLNWIIYNKLQEFELSTNEWKAVIQRNWWARLSAENPLIGVLQSRPFQDAIANLKTNEDYFTKDADALIFAECVKTLRRRLKDLSADEQAKMLAMFKEASRSKKPPVGLFVKRYYRQLRAIFPVWVMNPDIVAEFIPLNRDEFDYGIFDEASQMFLERGYPLVYRCANSTIAGDLNQLKPTSFFMTRFEDGGTRELRAADADSGDFELDENESIVSLLERAENAKWNKFHLRNHYRSTSKRLIEFSNANVYNGTLHIASLNGLWKNKNLEVVEVGGAWEDRRNAAEAAEVVRAVRLNHKKYDSILVIAFNLQQANLIEDMLLNGEGVELAVKDKIGKSIAVTNLESVQGSEADLVLLSVAFARGPDGTFRANFGAINKDGGKNRLNVAITRARDKMIVFKSFKAGDVGAQKALSGDAAVFVNWIRYLDNFGALEAEEQAFYKKKAQPAFGNKLAREIYDALSGLGLGGNYYLAANLPVGDRSVDVAVMDQNASQCALGIVADRWSTAMHAKTKAEECDFQFFLEARGYGIFRIKEYEWLLMKPAILDAIKARLADYGRAAAA